MAKRHFRFAARVLEHLGAELISSDDVAIYELVKNGFDAAVDRSKSSQVVVDVYYIASFEILRLLRSSLISGYDSSQKSLFLDQVLNPLKSLQPSEEASAESGDSGEADEDDAEEQELQRTIDSLTEVLPPKGTVNEYSDALLRVNRIVISDQGRGMSANDLDQHFLTIGTSNRREEHRRHLEDCEPYEGGYPPAGEKGIGRLSMMRLGRRAVIRTSCDGERNSHVLTIDWSRFIGDGVTNAQDVDVDLSDEPKAKEEHGTTIEISDLQSDWPLTKLEEVGSHFLSKFFDPFRLDKRRRILLRWNGTPVSIPRIGDAFLAEAPNGMKAKLTARGGGTFGVKCHYWFTTEAGVRKEYDRDYSPFDFGGIVTECVADVGSFEVELFHYNRRRLAAIPGVASREEFRKWLDEWSGGLKLYRDGVRVMPYGQGEARSTITRSSDDWLDLDSKALRGKGFRVNRIQVVGCVRISRPTNPHLVDQANREGLLDNEASRAFVAVLKELVRNFVSELDDKVRPVEQDLSELHDSAIHAQDEFEATVQRLIDAAAAGDRAAVTTAREEVHEALAGIRTVLDETQQALEDRQLNRIEVIELAATGVAAEAFAHDLEATLDQAIADTSSDFARTNAMTTSIAWMTHLRSVFKSLRVQISIIKPGPAKHRRRRGIVTISRVLSQVQNFYAGRLARHKIGWEVVSHPKGSDLEVYVVEGHLRQILDNLVRNSIYWLKQTREKEPQAPPSTITITVDARSKTLEFADSGVGVAVEDAEWVFGRFHSRRQNGRGLGLYLSRELCEFNGIKLNLDTAAQNAWGRSNTFRLDFGACRAPDQE